MVSKHAEFPPSVAEKLGYYVYILTDPRTNKPFYVGKGTGNRVFAHLRQAIRSPLPTDKLEIIRAIQAKGQQVKARIVRHGLTENEAFEVEASLIDYIGLPDLANVVAGHGTAYRGYMTIQEIVAMYTAPKIRIKEPSMLIVVNRLYRRGMNDDQLYEITRGNWVVGERRNKARFALCVYRGIVRQVYEIQGWFPVKARPLGQKTNDRWRFDGIISEKLQHYVGGSAEKYLRLRAQNPIKYVNC
jgi:hypothetical protein